MDVSRAILDNLMGRDRNKPKDLITQRDHYSNPDVCKPFLVCFCFNTLFPNTTYDQGPCQKRHDTYLKTMFDNDLSRSPFERQYIKQCIHWIQRRLKQVQKKTKQNQSAIDNKSNFPADRSKQTLDRIMAIEEDIERLMAEAQVYGSKGQIDESARRIEQVDKLRERRRQIQMMGSDLMNVQKQQRICQVCGAIQTINDTQKRIQTHLEGKIHQGFLKLRHQVQALKMRLQILNKMNPQTVKETREPQRVVQKQKQNTRAPERQRSQSPGKRRRRQKSRQKGSRDRRDRQKDRHADRQRSYRNTRDSRQRVEKKQRDRQRQRKQPKQRKYHRDSRQRDYKDRRHKESRDHRQSRDHKEHKKKHRKERSRSYERHRDY